MLFYNRSKVQGSTFKVKDQGKIGDREFSQQTLVLPDNCQESARFEIGDDEANLYLINTLPKWTLGTR